MIYHPQREQIRKHAEALVSKYGTSMRARERSVLALMDEHGISDKSACQYFSEAKKRKTQKNGYSKIRRQGMAEPQSALSDIR